MCKTCGKYCWRWWKTTVWGRPRWKWSVCARCWIRGGRRLAPTSSLTALQHSGPTPKGTWRRRLPNLRIRRRSRPRLCRRQCWTWSPRNLHPRRRGFQDTRDGARHVWERQPVGVGTVVAPSLRLPSRGGACWSGERCWCTWQSRASSTWMPSTFGGFGIGGAPTSHARRRTRSRLRRKCRIWRLSLGCNMRLEVTSYQAERTFSALAHFIIGDLRSRMLASKFERMMFIRLNRHLIALDWRGLRVGRRCRAGTG